MAPQQARTGVNRLTTWTGAEPDRNEIIFVFIFADYTRFRFLTMGCSTVGTTTVYYVKTQIAIKYSVFDVSHPELTMCPLNLTE